MPYRVMHRRSKLALVILTLGAATLPGCWMPNERAARAQAACVGLVPVSQLPPAADGAMLGDPAAFEAMRRLLVQIADESLYAGRGELRTLGDRIATKGELLLAQKDALVQAQQAMRAVDKLSPELLEASEQVSSQLLQAGAQSIEIIAAQHLAMLSVRLGKTAAGFVNASGIDAEAVFLLGKDLNAFSEILNGLLDGNPELRLPGAKAGPVREHLLKVKGLYEQLRQHSSQVLGHLQQLVTARDAKAGLVGDSMKLGHSLIVYCAGSGAAPSATAPAYPSMPASASR